MITGATRGHGGESLYRHWVKDKNVQVIAIQPRHIASLSLRDQVTELSLGAMHARFRRPILHLHVDPSPLDRPPTALELLDLWNRLEVEFGLTDQPFVGVCHVLPRDVNGVRHPDWTQDTHEHRAYSVCGPDGHMTDALHNDYIRRQRIVITWEFDNGFELTPVKHERAILSWADTNRPDVAQAMRTAGMDGRRPPRIARVSPAERKRTERAGIRRVTKHMTSIRSDVLGAWMGTQTPAGFVAAMSAFGYRLAQGLNAPMVLDPVGVSHSLPSLLSLASAGYPEMRITPGVVRARLKDIVLPTLAEARLLPALVAQSFQLITKDDGYADRANSRDRESDSSNVDNAFARHSRRDAGRRGPFTGTAGTAGRLRPDIGDSRAADISGRSPDTVGRQDGYSAVLTQTTPYRRRLTQSAPHRRLVASQFARALQTVDLSPLSQLRSTLRRHPTTINSVQLTVDRRHHDGLMPAPMLDEATWCVTAGDVGQDCITSFILRVRSRTYEPAISRIIIQNTIFEPAFDRVRLQLKTGGEIIEEPFRIILHGDADEVSVSNIIDEIRQRRWGRIKLTGTPEFLDAIGLALLIQAPEIKVVNPADLGNEILYELAQKRSTDGAATGSLTG